MAISIPSIGAYAPAAPSGRSARAEQTTNESDESFQPVWNNANKPAASAPKSAKEDTTDPGSSGGSKPKPASNGKSVKNPDPAAKKSDSAPVVVAPDPTPQSDPAIQLKTSAAPTEQPHQMSQPNPPVPAEVFTLPQAVASPAAAPASTAAITPTDSAQTDAQAPVDPGNLVFQLFLNSPAGSSKMQPAIAEANSKAEQTETPEFLARVEAEAESSAQTRAGGSSADAKNQDQRDQPPPAPQPLPLGSDGTIASQFGFQTPLSFAAHMPAATTAFVAQAAPTRATENVSASDLPAASAVDRIALTIRGGNDQVVRVEINQSGQMVQVGVNTANTNLASELRGSVPELMRRLDQQGYESRVSVPSSSSAPVTISTAHSEFRSGTGANGNSKSQGNVTSQDEPRQQRQRHPQRAWRELASQLQED